MTAAPLSGRRFARNKRAARAYARAARRFYSASSSSGRSACPITKSICVVRSYPGPLWMGQSNTTPRAQTIR